MDLSLIQIENSKVKPLEFDITKPQFVNGDVLSVLGLSLGTFQTWVNRGIVVAASGSAPGQGQRRLYSAIDICKVAVLAELNEFGFAPTDAKVISEHVGRTLLEGKRIIGNPWECGIGPDYTYMIYREDDKQRIRSDPEGEFNEFNKAFGITLFVPVGDIVIATLSHLAMYAFGSNGMIEAETKC